MLARPDSMTGTNMLTRNLGSWRRSRNVRAIGVVAAVALVASCSSSAKSASSSGTSAGTSSKSTLVIVTPNDSITWALDGGIAGTVPGVEPSFNTQATLLRNPYVPGKTYSTLEEVPTSFEGYLASGYTVSPNGLTYTFKLRDAISAAGNHLTSEDVIWSYERHFDTPTSVTPGVSMPVITNVAQQFKAIDAHTVSITISNAGYGITLLALLADLTGQIYDSTLLKQHATPSDPYAVKWSANNPNYGFGPYEVENYQPGVQTLLTANPNFVLGPPKIKNILLKVVPDAGTRANLVRDGDADMAEGVLPADLLSLKSNPATKIGEVDDPNEYLEFPLVANKAPFNNTAVRQAMAYAVPYQQIIQNVYHGLAVRHGPSFLVRSAPGYDGSGFTPFNYDPTLAKQMLAAAGYPNGVSYTLSVSSSEQDAIAAAIQIQTYAAPAGFKITIDQVPAAEYGTARQNKTFQAYLTDDFAITLTPSYELGVYTAADGGNNLAAWYDPTFYAALAAGQASSQPLSPATGVLWNAAERIFINSAPIVFIAQIQPDVAMRSDVDGFAWRSDNWVDYDNLSFGS